MGRNKPLKYTRLSKNTLATTVTSQNMNEQAAVIAEPGDGNNMLDNVDAAGAGNVPVTDPPPPIVHNQPIPAAGFPQQAVNNIANSAGENNAMRNMFSFWLSVMGQNMPHPNPQPNPPVQVDPAVNHMQDVRQVLERLADLAISNNRQLNIAQIMTAALHDRANTFYQKTKNDQVAEKTKMALTTDEITFAEGRSTCRSKTYRSGQNYRGKDNNRSPSEHKIYDRCDRGSFDNDKSPHNSSKNIEALYAGDPRSPSREIYCHHSSVNVTFEYIFFTGL